MALLATQTEHAMYVRMYIRIRAWENKYLLKANWSWPICSRIDHSCDLLWLILLLCYVLISQVQCAFIEQHINKSIYDIIVKWLKSVPPPTDEAKLLARSLKRWLVICLNSWMWVYLATLAFRVCCLNLCCMQWNHAKSLQRNSSLLPCLQWYH